MYNSIESFIKDFEHEQNSTIKYFNSISDEKLETIFHENIRTIGWLSWHIVVTVSEMFTESGFTIAGPDDRNVQPNNIAAMIMQYKSSCESVVAEVKNNWTDAMLTETITMYGRPWIKGNVLGNFLLHQAHHRGQLSTIMRFADFKVPGVFGPSKDEWTALGQTFHK